MAILQSVRRRQGLTLVEVLIAMAIMAIGIIGVISAIVTAQRSEMAARENLVAQNAAKRVLERVRGTTFGTIATTWTNRDFAIDPAGEPIYPPLPAGLVHGLAAVDGDADGMPGRVTVTTVETDLLDVSVTVQWSGIQKSTTLHFRSLMTPR